jgi:hypothetical protein
MGPMGDTSSFRGGHRATSIVVAQHIPTIDIDIASAVWHRYPYMKAGVVGENRKVEPSYIFQSYRDYFVLASAEPITTRTWKGNFIHDYSSHAQEILKDQLNLSIFSLLRYP